MRIKSRLTIVLALIAGFGVIGLIETVGADPKGVAAASRFGGSRVRGRSHAHS